MITRMCGLVSNCGLFIEKLWLLSVVRDKYFKRIHCLVFSVSVLAVDSATSCTWSQSPGNCDGTCTVDVEGAEGEKQIKQGNRMWKKLVKTYFLYWHLLTPEGTQFFIIRGFTWIKVTRLRRVLDMKSMISACLELKWRFHHSSNFIIFYRKILYYLQNVTVCFDFRSRSRSRSRDRDGEKIAGYRRSRSRSRSRGGRDRDRDRRRSKGSERGRSDKEREGRSGRY